MRYALSIMVLLLIAGAYAQLEDAASVTISLVNQDPDPAVAGDMADVRLGVQNVGGTSFNDLLVEIDPSYPFTLVAGESAVQDIGSVPGYAGTDSANLRIVKFRLAVDRDAKAGSYELIVKHYEKGTSAVVETRLNLDVKSRESAEVIHIDKTSLVPGRQEALTFRINNVGNSPLRDLTFYWENSDSIILPVGSDNTRSIRYIDIGDSEDIEYQVIADSNAAAGLYKLDLHLSYQDSLNSSQKTISTIAGVYVGGGTDFDIAFSESSSGQTSFTVANIGSNPANSVSVIIPEQQGWSTTGSSTVIIGNLNKGDYTVASFKLSSSNRTVGRQNSLNQTGVRSSPDMVALRIAYTDTMGNRQQVEKHVKVQQSLTSADSSTYASRRQNAGFMTTYGWYMLAAVAITGTVVGWYFYRKRGKKR